VVGGGDERVEEHQGEARKLLTGFAGREGGRKSELRGDLERGGANGGGGDSGRREGARPGAQSREERGGEVGGVLAKQWEGREQNKEWGTRRPARHGSPSSWRVDGNPWCAGTETAPRGKAEKHREGTVDGEDGAWPARAARGRRPRLVTEQGRMRERESRERLLTDSKFEFFSRISFET